MTPVPASGSRNKSLGLLGMLLYASLVLIGCGAGGGGSGDGGTPGDTTIGGSIGSTANGTGNILGVVKNAFTGVGIAGAQVVTGGKATVTDSDGNFLLSTVPAGTVMVVGSATGFATGSKVVFLNNGANLSLEFGLTASTGGTSGGGTVSTGPRFASTNPTKNATAVDPASDIIFTLNQDVQPSTLNTSGIVFSRLTAPAANDSGSSSIQQFPGISNTFIYRPGNLQMEAGKQYGLFLTNRVIGTNGLPSPGDNAIWDTRAGPAGGGGGGPLVGPTLIFTSPADNATDVDTNTRLFFQFDTSMDTTSVLNPGVSVVLSRLTTPTASDTGGTITVVTGLSNTFEYDPGPGFTPLVSGTRYGLFVTNRVLSAAGAPSLGESFDFVTRTSSSGSGPVIEASNPANNATGVDPFNTQILFTLSSNTDVNTVLPAGGVAFTRTLPTFAQDSPTIVQVDGAPTFRVIPSSAFTPLTGGATYRLAINNQVMSTGGVRSPGSAIAFDTQSTGSGSGAPTIANTNPSNDATNVATDTLILVTFSEPVDPTTVSLVGAASMTQTSPTVRDLDIVLTPTATPANSILVNYDPLGTGLNLSEQSTYQINISNKIRDLQGNPTQGGSFSFRTRQVSSGSSGGTGIIVPTLQASNPVAGATGVDVNSRILLTFSTAMDVPSLQQAGSIIFTQQGSPSFDLQTVSVVASAVPNTFEIVKLGTGAPFQLLSQTLYSIFLTNSIKAAGATGGFLQPTSFSFTTRQVQGGAGDTTAPLLAASNPSNNATNVDTGIELLFSFNELVVTSSVTGTSVRLSQTSAPSSIDLGQSVTALNETFDTTNNVSVASDFRYNRGTLSLSPGQSYQLGFTNQIQDAAGNRLQPVNVLFAVSTVQELASGPSLSSSNPPDGATGVDPSSSILFTFDKDVCPGDADPLLDPNDIVTACPTINTATIKFARVSQPAASDGPIVGDPTRYLLRRPDPLLLPRTFEYVPGTLGIQPGLVRYSVAITNGVRDTQQNASPGDTFTFTTTDFDVNPGLGPRIVGTNPGNRITVNPNARILVQFDKPIDFTASGLDNPGGFLAGGGGAQALTAIGIHFDNNGICGNDPPTCLTSDDLICDPVPIGPHEIRDCNCLRPLTVTGYAAVGASFGLPAAQVVEIVYSGVLPNNTIWVSTNGFLVDTDGNPAPDDFFVFFTPQGPTPGFPCP